MPKKTTERLTEIKLRVRPQLHREMVAAAKFNGRSLNAELNERLERSLSGLAEEVLIQAFGPLHGPQLIGAYRQGMLRIDNKAAEHIKAAISRWVDQFQNAVGG